MYIQKRYIRLLHTRNEDIKMIQKHITIDQEIEQMMRAQAAKLHTSCSGLVRLLILRNEGSKHGQTL